MCWSRWQKLKVWLLSISLPENHFPYLQTACCLVFSTAARGPTSKISGECTVLKFCLLVRTCPAAPVSKFTICSLYRIYPSVNLFCADFRTMFCHFNWVRGRKTIGKHRIISMQVLEWSAGRNYIETWLKWCNRFAGSILVWLIWLWWDFCLTLPNFENKSGYRRISGVLTFWMTDTWRKSNSLWDMFFMFCLTEALHHDRSINC